MKLSKTAMINEMMNANYDCYNHNEWHYKAYIKGRITKEALNVWTANYLIYHTAGSNIVERKYNDFKSNL